MARHNLIWFICGLLAVVDVVLWQRVAAGRDLRPGYYFLDVGQGDSELVVMPNGAMILIDGGPDARVVPELEKIMPAGDRYLDVIINSHPQRDHFAGLTAVIQSYGGGAFLWNGRDDSPDVGEWRQLRADAAAAGIPMIPLGRGDMIRVGSGTIDVVSPDGLLAQSAELNDTGLVMRAAMPGAATLFTADIDARIESYLVRRDASALRADFLKIAHHGSRYSSGGDFLRAVGPRAAVIEVGARNTYGHPSREALQRIASSTDARVFRTDRDGTVFAGAEYGGLTVAIWGSGP